MQIPKRAIAVIAAVLAVLAGGGALVITVLPDDDPRVPPATVTVPVDGLDPGIAPDKTLTVPAPAVEQAKDALSGDVPASLPLDSDDADHTDQRDETPPEASVSDLDDNADELAENRRTTQALPTAGASAGFAGCRTQFVGNQSSRRGVRPTVQVLHYTVSPNRHGWSDVDGITAFFARSSSQASSHFVIDAEGNCAYIVPIEAKAWTQAGGNPWSVSYEIIATGKESDYLAPAGYAKLRSVIAQVATRTGIPLRAGAITGCAPARSGIVQHAHGGTCWGGHHDIGPFAFATVLARVTAGGCDAKCQRTRSLRARNAATHTELRRRHCAPIDQTRSDRCLLLHRRHRAIHTAANREGRKL
jgi:hypothetical protein